MNLSIKNQVLILLSSVLLAYGFGRYSKSDVKTSEKINQTEQTNETKNTHTKTTITETKKADGTDTTTTTIDQVANDNKTEKDNTTVDYQQTISKGSKINISVLGANDFSRGLLVPTYGLSVQKEFLGPITVGAFGLMNGVIGVSVGVDF